MRPLVLKTNTAAPSGPSQQQQFVPSPARSSFSQASSGSQLVALAQQATPQAESLVAVLHALSRGNAPTAQDHQTLSNAAYNLPATLDKILNAARDQAPPAQAVARDEYQPPVQAQPAQQQQQYRAPSQSSSDWREQQEDWFSR